jgi:hypothetical protein
MLRLLAGLLLVLVSLLALTACLSRSQTGVPPTGNKSPEENTPELSPLPDTQFSRMFDLVPYFFLKEHDIWFGDPGKAKEIYGFGNIESEEAYSKLSDDERRQMAADLRGVIQPGWRWPDLAALTGYDYMRVESLILAGPPPPWKISISRGDFDDVSIGQKLTEEGYEKKTYGAYTYYSQFDDFQILPTSPISSLVMADFNRIAVLHDSFITAPATGILTAIVDTMANESDSVTDNAACRALAESLGEVLSGGFIAPERVIDPAPGHSENLPLFDFAIPDDWGLLHQYEMVGAGYKDDGRERFWVISLYYANGNNAQEDAERLAKRMSSYEFNTQYRDRSSASFKVTPLAERFDVGAPLVRTFANGATVTVECHYKEETANSAWLQPTYMLRDLLFLAPDPKPYVEEK